MKSNAAFIGMALMFLMLAVFASGLAQVLWLEGISPEARDELSP